MTSEWVLLALQRATHATLQVLAAELAELGLTAAEINVLAILGQTPGRTVSEICDAAGSRPSTITSVLDRLQYRGHIARRSREGDRRVVVIDLTGSGRDAADTIHRTLASVEERALDDLPPDAVAGFRTVLRALTEMSL